MRDFEKFREIAEPNIILRVEVGSTVHGCSLENQDDRDEMGVCLEPPHYVVGLGSFEQWIHRTAEDRHRMKVLQGMPFPPDFTPRSEPGDLDLVVFSLRKWCRMALKGNPSAMMLLFSPSVISTSPTGDALRGLAPAFFSRQVGKAYIGYMNAQRKRMAGQRGGKDVNRRELVDKFGFDTKYAYHMLRLGYQGEEYLLTGRIELPIVGPIRERLINVRLGKIALKEILEEAEEMEHRLEKLLAAVPEAPHADVVDQFVQDSYQEHWGWYPDAAVRMMAR